VNSVSPVRYSMSAPTKDSMKYEHTSLEKGAFRFNTSKFDLTNSIILMEPVN
jgi:hypothetical protein